MIVTLVAIVIAGWPPGHEDDIKFSKTVVEARCDHQPELV